MTESSVNKPAKDEQNIAPSTQPTPVKKPDDAAGISVQGHIKIYDPESGEMLVNKRTC